MGGVFGHKWFSVQWPEGFEKWHINILEMIAVTTGVLTWFKRDYNKKVLIYSDNKTIVDIWFSGSTPNVQLMSIIRYLFYFLAKHDIEVTLQHVFGYNNTAADLLSRLQVQDFAARYPLAEKQMSPIPTDIWGILSS